MQQSALVLKKNISEPRLMITIPYPKIIKENIIKLQTANAVPILAVTVEPLLEHSICPVKPLPNA